MDKASLEPINEKLCTLLMLYTLSCVNVIAELKVGKYPSSIIEGGESNAYLLD